MLRIKEHGLSAEQKQGNIKSTLPVKFQKHEACMHAAHPSKSRVNMCVYVPSTMVLPSATPGHEARPDNKEGRQRKVPDNQTPKK